MEDNIYQNDGQNQPNPGGGGGPQTSDMTATTEMDDQNVREALAEPGIVMVNCAGTNVAVQVIPGPAAEGRAPGDEDQHDTGEMNPDDPGDADETGDAGMDGSESGEGRDEDYVAESGSDGEEDGEAEGADVEEAHEGEENEVAPTSAPIMNSNNPNMISIFKEEVQDDLLKSEDVEEGHGENLDTSLESKGDPSPTSERRRSTRKRKGTPVYRIVSLQDDPLDDLDEEEVQSKAKRRPRRKCQTASVKTELLPMSDDDDYIPTDVDDLPDDLEEAGGETTTPAPRRQPTRTRSTSRTTDTSSSKRKMAAVKKKNTVTLGAANMGRWERLKEDLGVTQDYHFSRKILEFLEDNVENLKKAKKPRIKEEPPEDPPHQKPYNPHAEESSDPFVCIQTNWEVKRWYLELVSHAKRSTSGFLAHLLGLYCKIHSVDLPPDNTLFRNDMENEATPGDKMEEICNCDGNNYAAQENHVDTSEIGQVNVDLVETALGNLQAAVLPGQTQVVQMGVDALRTAAEPDMAEQNDFNNAEFRQGFALGAAGANEANSSQSSSVVAQKDDTEVEQQNVDNTLPIKKQKLKNMPNISKKPKREYGVGHPAGISKEDYILHEIVGKNDIKKKYYECALCHKIYKSWSIFAHIRIHKGEKHCCRQCGKHAVEQRSKATLRKPPKQSNCPYCPFFSTVRSVMKEHLGAKHPDEVAASERFLCEHCGKELKSKASLKDHRRTHTPQVRNKICDICGKAFTTRRFLRIHISGVHGTKKHKCPHDGCDLAFNTRNMVRTHVNRVHLHIKKVNCTYEGCMRNFFSRSELQRHIRVYHTKEKLFNCTWEGCGKAFRTPYHVQVHMRIHTDEKPLKCPHCEYRARQRNALNWHMKKHDPNNANKPAPAPRPRAPRPPKQKPLPPLPRHENFHPHHEQPQPGHQPRLQTPYQPHHQLPNQYEFNGIPPNPFQMPDNNYLPYPQQSVFPPGGPMQYQSL